MTHVSHTTLAARQAIRRGARPALASVALGVMLAAGAAPAHAEPNPDTLNRLMQARPAQESVRLSPVREAALESSARALGTQTGLIERAKEISNEVSTRRIKIENAFRFGDLVIGQGVLPPVLLHTKNAATVTDDTMRLAGAVYEIKHPARFFSGAPSWRDWLLMGLPDEAQMPAPPTNEQLLPRDEKERAFWQQKVKEAYFSGREQAQEIFDHNLSMLEQVYTGMRTFYDLYQRNMVSAPIIAKSQEIVTQDDPNTIVVGDTLFRITMPAQFQTNPEQWRALEALPSTKPLLPIGHGYDPEQVRHAYATYQEQQAAREAKLQAEALAKRPFAKPAKAVTTVKTAAAEPVKLATAQPVAVSNPISTPVPTFAAPPVQAAQASTYASEQMQAASVHSASAPTYSTAQYVPPVSTLEISASVPLFANPSR